MSGDFYYQKSLIEQIYEVMFTRILERDEFDSQTVQKLHRLATEGKLDRTPQIVEAIAASVKEP